MNGEKKMLRIYRTKRWPAALRTTVVGGGFVWFVNRFFFS